MEQPITALQTPDCDWLLHRFIEVNFSKLMDSDQIFRNYFVGLHYHLCKISSQIIECIIFAPYELSITIIYSMLWPSGHWVIRLGWPSRHQVTWPVDPHVTGWLFHHQSTSLRKYSPFLKNGSPSKQQTGGLKLWWQNCHPSSYIQIVLVVSSITILPIFLTLVSALVHTIIVVWLDFDRRSFG